MSNRTHITRHHHTLHALRSAITLACTAGGMMATITLASAQSPGIILGNPSYGGTGCPMGTASATLSPDNTSLSLIFDQYTLEAGRAVQKRIDRKSCNIAIPVNIPEGYSVSVYSIDYRGFNNIPAGGRSQFDVEYFFAGARGPRYSVPFYGPVTDNFTISNQLQAHAMVWSPCGADVVLRTNSSMYVQTNGYQEQASASVDSVDVSAGIIYHLQWRRCQ